MPRYEGPTKLDIVNDLIETLQRIGVNIGEPAPNIHRGMWYNIDRKGIDQLSEFFLTIERRLENALDSARRLQPHQESLDPGEASPVGQDRE